MLISKKMMALWKKGRTSFIKSSKEKQGLPPGSLLYVGDVKIETEFTTISYSPTSLQVKEKPHDIVSPENEEIVWHNVVGLQDVGFVEKVGKTFAVDSLTLEDIVHTGQRPKLEEYDNYLYFVVKMLSLDSSHHLQVEQVSLVLGQGFLLSFQELPGDVFETVRDRLKNSKGKLRKLGADYLCYALIDAIVDNYFLVLENLNEKLENLEDRVLRGEENEITANLFLARRNLVLLRKSIWPLREVLRSIIKNDTPLITKELDSYFQDVYDHAIQIIETTEAMREMATSIREMHMTEISNRMNNVMKVLTIIATIFIPITFIAGIYGMNFENMPELKWEYGYVSVWGIFLVITLGMLWFFRRKNWL